MSLESSRECYVEMCGMKVGNSPFISQQQLYAYVKEGPTQAYKIQVVLLSLETSNLPCRKLASAGTFRVS